MQVVWVCCLRDATLLFAGASAHSDECSDVAGDGGELLTLGD
jgi:hypothetical protein